MTRSGAEYLAGLRDGRQVYINGELVEDVTTHPAFADAVLSIAGLYDISNDPANRELMTFPSPRTGEPVNRSFMIPRSADDLALRRKAIKRWSEATFGLMGRSPDHVASYLAAFAGAPEIFARGSQRFADNVVAFYEHARDNDLYVTYTIVPPQIDRSKPAHQQEDPHLYAGVAAERDDGIIIRGAQMLGTGTAISDYILLSCIHPLKAGDENHAISVAVPLSAPGLKVLSRRSYAQSASSVYDYPLSSRFDETDSLVVFDDVFVPWERVFVYRDLDIVRAQFFETAAHLLGNNQAQIRFSTKLAFLVGLARKIAEMNGVDKLPPVQGTLGELAAYAAMVEGLVLAQEQACEIDGHGVARPGASPLYSNMVFQSQIYPTMFHMVRDLCGGGLIQLPSSSADFENPGTAAILDRYVRSPGMPSRERVKLLKLAWDLIGSEFASRHHQYEMFYAGAPFLVKGHMYRHFDFASATSLVDSALAGYDLLGRNDVTEPTLREQQGATGGGREEVVVSAVSDL
jgi:4-hydroxyphenylacetate 3-monooxygenase